MPRKEEEFTFASLIKPGEGVKLAMQRELEKRKALDDTRFKWEPGYVYSGAADLLLKHGEFFNGRQLPDKYERKGESRCFLNALETAEAHPGLRYFQGLYMVSGTSLAHAWCVDEEGVIEATFWTVGQDDEGRRVVIKPHGGGRGSLPWSPPEHWGYWGVEFDPAWVRDWFEHTSHMEYSVLDPRRQDEAARGAVPTDDWIFRHAYTPTGIRPLPDYTPPAQPDFDEDWYDDESDEEEPYA